VGPEHSSARIERYLQLVNSQAWARGAASVSSSPDKCVREAANMIVAQPSTPANYFHLLRCCSCCSCCSCSCDVPLCRAHHEHCRPRTRAIAALDAGGRLCESSASR
jgi:hypothetical protein